MSRSGSYSVRDSAEASFDRQNLVQASLMSFLARKPGAEEDGRDFLRQRSADDARAETEHVHGVMLDGLVRGVGIVAGGRPDSRELVGGDRSPARAADDDAAVSRWSVSATATAWAQSDIGRPPLRVPREHLVTLPRRPPPFAFISNPCGRRSGRYASCLHSIFRRHVPQRHRAQRNVSARVL